MGTIGDAEHDLQLVEGKIHDAEQVLLTVLTPCRLSWHTVLDTCGHGTTLYF